MNDGMYGFDRTPVNATAKQRGEANKELDILKAKVEQLELKNEMLEKDITDLKRSVDQLIVDAYRQK